MTTLSTFLKDWNSTVVPLLIILVLLAIFLLYFKKGNNGFVKYLRYILLPFTFISGFIIYFWGYQIGNSEGESYAIIPNLLESFFSTTRLFILGNDLIEIEHKFKVENHMFHALFALTAALAAFVFVSFIVQVFFKDLLIRWKIIKFQKSENHFFFGISESSLALANDLIQNNNKRLIVFVNDIYKNDNQQLYSQLPTEIYVLKRKNLFDSIQLEKEEGLLGFMNADHKQSDSNNSLFYNIKSLKRKIGLTPTHLYFITNDDDWNIKHARQVIAELKKIVQSEKNKKHRNNTENDSIVKPIWIHVATYNEISEKHFTNSLENLPDFISVVVHNYATLVSRQLIEMQHPVNFVGINKEQAVATTDFNALIIGFGQIGTHVLRKLIEQGQFVGSTFHATVIDQFVHSLEGRFEHLYPGVKTNYDVQFVESEVGQRSFYETVKSVIGKTNYIVIALGQDDLNIQTALEILEINSVKDQKLLRLFIQLEDETHWKATLKKYEERISIFGESNKVFTESNILQQDVEERARLVHQVYNILNKTNVSFDKIPRHDQLSNISVAEHLYAKVKLLGNEDMVEFSNKFASNDEYTNSLTKVQELNLSILEHLRWNAFHFIHGWTTLPLEEITGDTKEERDKNRRKDDLRIHACLTTWEKLEQIGKLIGKDMQEYDTKSVKHLYDFINYKSNEKL